MIYIISGCYHNFFFLKKHFSVMYTFEFTCIQYRSNISYDLLSCSLWGALHFLPDQLFFSQGASRFSRDVSCFSRFIEAFSMEHITHKKPLCISTASMLQQSFICKSEILYEPIAHSIWVTQTYQRFVTICLYPSFVLSQNVRKQLCVYELSEGNITEK